MNFARFSVLALGTALLLGTAACAGTTDDDAASDSSSEDELRATKITEADADKTIRVMEGQLFAIALSSNPSSGYDWKVVSTDKTLGYPYRTSWSSGSSAVGSGGTTWLFWRTGGPLSTIGKHEIELGYKRSWETGEPLKKLHFTVEVVGTAPPPAATNVVEVDGPSGSTIPVKRGQDILVKLAGPQTFGWALKSTTKSLGAPTVGWVQGEGAIGDSGYSTFLWKTSNFPISGAHKVVFEIDRGHGDGTQTIEYTFDISAP